MASLIRGPASRTCLALLIVLPLALSGCGGGDKVKTVPVKGKLTLDGQPFGPLTLQFVLKSDKSKSATGLVDASGNIAITTYEVGDGAPVGDYKVYAVPDPSGNTAKLPDVYLDAENTILSASVADSTTEVTIDMKTTAGPISGVSNLGNAPGNSGAMDALRASDPAFKKK